MAHAINTAAVSAPSSAPQDFRRSRHVKRNMKLHHQIRDLVSAHPDCRYVGGNAAVEDLAAHAGFLPHDLAIADVRIGRRIVTLICVPHRVWDRAFPMSKVVDLKDKARFAGHTVVLVPQAVIQREPRLGNSELIARTAKHKVDATSRMAILHHLIENGASCLSELAELVTHIDPFGAVLHLVTTGAIEIDMSQCITPYSMVDIASPAGMARN